MTVENTKNTVYRQVLDKVLKIHHEPFKADPEKMHYNELYKEIVSRCVADVAGILQTGENAGGPGAELGKMYQQLSEKHGTDAARNLILGNLSGYTKGLVHTPHPTELLSKETIEAQEELMAALKDMPALFKNDRGRLPSRVDHARLSKALEKLSGAIKPLSKALTVDKEMLRSLEFSQRQFDAIPGIADTVMRVTETDSGTLSFDELRRFGHLVSPETWSPGDQDSKPDMTAEKLQKGAVLGHRAMMFHYFRELAVLGANTEGLEISAEAKDKIQHMMHRLLKTGYDAYEPARKEDKPLNYEFAEQKLQGESVEGGGASSGANGAPTRFAQRYEHYVKSSFMKGFKADFEAGKEVRAYKNTEEFLADLKGLREKEPGTAKLREEPRNHLGMLDALIIQAMNFGDTALRVQIRQNATVHAKVVDQLLSMLPQSALPAGVDVPPPTEGKEELQRRKKQREESSASIEHLLEAFKSDTAFAALVKEKVKNYLAAQDPQSKDPFYQVMESLGYAAQHPDRVPRYLIAETRSKTDLLEAFFLLKVMESLRAPEVKNKVEIVNLVEHPDLMTDKGSGVATAQMTLGALQNEQFCKHHMGITTNAHLLEDYSLKEGYHRLTVAEAKRAFGLELAPGDEARRIMSVKMLMAAGSDVTKAGGVAAAAATMDAIERTREALLNNTESPTLLVDYIGVGGGIHRTQPVSTQFETVQGNSLRQSPENIAQKVIGRVTEFLHKRLAMNPTEDLAKKPDESAQQWRDRHTLVKEMPMSTRRKLAQVNLSNMANLRQDDARWNRDTKPRTYAMMGKYQKLYESEELAALVSYSADMFAGLTKFAARPLGRVDGGRGAGDEKKDSSGFLKKYTPEQVKEIRAIGFGAALNAAGINAPMFFGGSAYLNDESVPWQEQDKILRDMYLYDPKAQDTINRMTYGVLMADMDVAWKYQGRDKAPDAVELKKLAATEPAKGDTKASAAKALADINLEYDEVAGRLLRLHKMVAAQSVPTGPYIEPLDGKKAATEILSLLPAALREQIGFSRENLKKPRRELAELFDKMAKGEVDPGKVADKSSDEYKNIVWPCMAAIFEFTEHAPRAYTRPKWVEATMEQQRAA